jgi:WD40 repeat protein
VLELSTGKDRLYAGGRDRLVRGHVSAWSPVEDLVAYAGDVDPNDGEVGLIRSDGTEQRVLAKDIRSVSWMDFSPDGKWLLVASYSTPLTLFEVATGARLPLATLPKSQVAAWRP